MNDFTKEELQIIHLDMTIYAKKTHLLKESPSHQALRDKVQSMIDNYCEHEFIATTDPKDWNKNEAYAIVLCRKCNCSPRTTK